MTDETPHEKETGCVRWRPVNQPQIVPHFSLFVKRFGLQFCYNLRRCIIATTSKYGTPNFRVQQVAVGSKKLDEEAEAAREKAERGEELSWREQWLLK
jgi:hypothetical protein